MKSKTAEVKEILMKGMREAWRAIKPLMQGILMALLSMGQRLIAFYEDAIDELTDTIEEHSHFEHPKLSRVMAHMLFWSIMIFLIVMAYVGNSVRIWFRSLDKNQINALINLGIVAIIGYLAVIILMASVARSIAENGFIRTILSIAILFFAIKGLSLLFAWSLTLNFGVDTPALDNLVAKAAILPEKAINAATDAIPWIMENYKILFNK